MNSVKAHDIARALAEDLRTSDTPLATAYRTMSERDQALQGLAWIVLLLKVG
jgi:hypothetical protein